MAEPKKKAKVDPDTPSGIHRLKIALWIIPVIILGFIAYMIFYGTDPRRQLETLEDTLAAYTDFVQPFVGPNPTVTPDEPMVNKVMEFFDSDSRAFFRNNYEHMARIQLYDQTASFLQLDQAVTANRDPGATFEDLSDGRKRVAALVYLINQEPLSGTVSVRSRSPREDGGFDVTVTTRSGRTARMIVVKRDGLWLMQDLGGIREKIEKQVEAVKPKP